MRLALTGDVLVHSTVWESAAREAARQGRDGYDFGPMLRPIRPLISGADLALCHLETPLARVGEAPSSWPLFAAPPSIVQALRATGYDGCSTASNHSIDQGMDGVVRTLDALDDAGLAHAGTARTPAEARRITVFDRNGMRIAWLSATWSLNGLTLDTDHTWAVAMIEVERILADARRARAEGADAVVVALHWGEEYWNTPSDWQLDVAERLTRPGVITLVYGHHTHLVQPVRSINRTPVIFGLGNLVADQRGQDPGTDTGLLAEVVLRQRGDQPVEVVSIDPRTVHPDPVAGPDGEMRAVDVRTELARGDLTDAERGELLESVAEARDGLSR